MTAIPAMGNVRPERVTRSPTRTPRAAAKPRSTTTAPPRTQPPEVTNGRFTGPGAAPAPYATACVLASPAVSVVYTMRYGPLWAETSGESVNDARAESALRPESADTATRSGPAVACRVWWYIVSVAPLSDSPRARAAVAAVIESRSIAA
ncbi:hypothetical protein [Nonomuraea sp. NEAU-A123]|uniref:hypothetical protein n=1 Tax=Nonomuraea sp. NEAU-A123 TaxID=2839649 RepID=UPI001BE42C93|nr:hypothetical protein [Nonomuraea sp. NEAU-A123]MBT2235687.1 hypothetical protein [Nonomuraea sp. NEAU-A123]